MKTEDYVCQRCGATATREVKRGTRPKWCADCRAAAYACDQTKQCVDCGRAGLSYDKRVIRCSDCTPFRKGRPASCQVPRSHPSRVVVPPPRQWVAGYCRECSAPFIDRQPTAQFCSLICGKRHHRRVWKERTGRTVPASVRRQVYSRDDGVCQLCGEPVLMDATGQHPLGPSVDHIVCQSWVLIPDHSISNLRLAHRICNAKRGDRAS